MALGLLALGGCDFLKCLFDLGWDCGVNEPGPEANVQGRWTGQTGPIRIEGIPEPLQYVLLAFDGVYEVDSVALTLDLTQGEGGRVTGTVKAGAVLTFEVAVSGRVMGSTLSLVGSKRFFNDTPAYDIQLVGEVGNNTSIQGTWKALEGATVVKNGTWIAKRS